MMKPLLAAAVLALSAIPAFADLETPTGGTATSSYNGFNTTPFGSGPLAAIDAVYIETNSVPVPAGGTNTFNLNIPSTWGNDLRVFISMGNVPFSGTVVSPVYTFEVQSATYTDGDGTTFSTGVMAGSYFLQPFGTIVLPVAAFVNTAGGTIAGFDPGTVTSLQIVFVDTPGGSGNVQFQVDRISNPEPGTLALFGLGALGLGGFAMRRRKARKAAAVKA